MIQPPRWTDEQLGAGIQKAKELFRKERLEEPAEAYDRAFSRYEESIKRLLDLTHNLTKLDDKIVEVLTAQPLLEAFDTLRDHPSLRMTSRCSPKPALAVQQFGEIPR